MGIYNEELILRQLRVTNFNSDLKKYAFVKLPFQDRSKLLGLLLNVTKPFFEFILDKNEITVVAEEKIWNDIKPSLNPLKEDFPLGLITCDVVEDNATGYLLKVLEVLSPNNIGVYVQGAYTTDNILVHYDDLDKALSLLKNKFNRKE